MIRSTLEKNSPLTSFMILIPQTLHYNLLLSAEGCGEKAVVSIDLLSKYRA